MKKCIFVFGILGFVSMGFAADPTAELEKVKQIWVENQLSLLAAPFSAECSVSVVSVLAADPGVQRKAIESKESFGFVWLQDGDSFGVTMDKRFRTGMRPRHNGSFENGVLYEEVDENVWTMSTLDKAHRTISFWRTEELFKPLLGLSPFSSVFPRSSRIPSSWDMSGYRPKEGEGGAFIRSSVSIEDTGQELKLTEATLHPTERPDKIVGRIVWLLDRETMLPTSVERFNHEAAVDVSTKINRYASFRGGFFPVDSEIVTYAFMRTTRTNLKVNKINDHVDANGKFNPSARPGVKVVKKEARTPSESPFSMKRSREEVATPAK